MHTLGDCRFLLLISEITKSEKKEERKEEREGRGKGSGDLHVLTYSSLSLSSRVCIDFLSPLGRASVFAVAMGDAHIYSVGATPNALKNSSIDTLPSWLVSRLRIIVITC